MCLRNTHRVCLIVLFGLVVILTVFLRFYKIEELQFFTYDQARDYLIIKKMILDNKFTLVGPTVLAPGVYLPPFYYYSLIPFLWFSNFHLVGADIYTAILGTGAVIIFFLLAKDLFGIKIALFSSLIFSLNPYLVLSSRHAWNPNTISFFSLLFAFGFERYLFGGKRYYLLVSAFAISWALNLHYTVVVFLPLFLYLLFNDFRKHNFNKYFMGAVVIFFLFISPIFLFELRHNFPNLTSLLKFVTSQGGVSLTAEVSSRFIHLLIDLFKMPIVLITGLNKIQNLTINPSLILLWDNVSPSLAPERLGNFYKLLSAFLISFFAFFLMIKKAIWIKNKEARFILFFLLFGFLIRLVFPQRSFYFYHYTFLYPFVFLVIAFLLNDIFSRPLFLLKVFLLANLLVLTILSWTDKDVLALIKDERYFLPAAAVISEDYFSSPSKIAMAANVADKTRWDHNALEYRYFLESSFRLPSTGWEESDYQNADVLYLIDEGELTEPLKLGGMEVEAFKPTKIVNQWKVETGQKIYRMIK